MNSIFDCKNINKLLNLVTLILPYHGYSKSIFCICQYKGNEFLTKISFAYKTQPEIYDEEKSGDYVSPLDAELRILEQLKKDIIYGNKSPCILEIIHNQSCAGAKEIKNIYDQISAAAKENPQSQITSAFFQAFDRFQKMIDQNLANPAANFTILEECDITLYTFLATKYTEGNKIDAEIFKSLLFQVTHVLCVIREKYPRFLHNDLHTENIMLKFEADFVFDPKTIQYLELNFAGQTYYVPFFGIYAKLIDFGFSCIPEKKIISTYELDKSLKFSRRGNDIVYLFRDIWQSNFKKPSIYNLLAEIDKNKLYIEYPDDVSQFPQCEKIINMAAFAAYKSNKNITTKNIWHKYK